MSNPHVNPALCMVKDMHEGGIQREDILRALDEIYGKAAPASADHTHDKTKSSGLDETKKCALRDALLILFGFTTISSGSGATAKAAYHAITGGDTELDPKAYEPKEEHTKHFVNAFTAVEKAWRGIERGNKAKAALEALTKACSK